MQEEELQRELIDLAFAVCDGIASDEQIERIEQLLATNPAARLTYLQCLELHQDMDRNVGAMIAALAREPIESSPSETAAASFPILVNPPYGLASPSASSFMPSGFLLSYGVAAAIVGVGMLLAWACKISVTQEFADNSSRRQEASHPAPEIEFVGQITDMVDCRWPDPKTEPFRGARIPLDRMYTLSSGLLEITYDTGVKVILQGPCTYQVKSTTSGHLSLGKLTARIMAKGERPDASPIAPRPAPQFAVHTPTAIVTDLGTEFGVEVDKSGASSAHVFRGKVKIQTTGGGPQKTALLGANESARVEIDSNRIASVVRQPSPKYAFVREMPKLVPIGLFNTGAGLKTGDPDRHWQIIARSDDPNFKAQPAVVARPSTPNAIDTPPRSRWIAPPGDEYLPDDVVYAFRTTFDLSGVLPSTVAVRGKLIADDLIVGIRLNGRKVKVPFQHEGEPYAYWAAFSITTGFVKGTNVLEFDVLNANPSIPPAQRRAEKTRSPIYCIIELEGKGIRDPGLANAETDPETSHAPPKDGKAAPASETPKQKASNAEKASPQGTR
jgi:hypothetical protein